jgi:hypothetical protein
LPRAIGNHHAFQHISPTKLKQGPDKGQVRLAEGPQLADSSPLSDWKSSLVNNR